jgi:hypothetical protein
MTSEKVQSLVTGWVQVDENEVEQEYRKRNEKVKLDWRVPADPSECGAADRRGHQGAVQADREVRLPEKRRVKYWPSTTTRQGPP